MNIIDNKAFTLVELIVVITILSVLSTIWFLSFQWYGVSSRDAVRISDMRMIEKWLSVKISKAEQIPIPDNKIDITASGTLLTYQWYAWTGTLWNIWVNGGWKDPLDKRYYTYSTNPARNKYQLLGFFENQWNISLFNNTTYADISERYPVVKWDDLGIILDPVTNIPSQDSESDIDIITFNNNLNIIINNTSDGNIIWSGTSIISQISQIKKYANCREILRIYWDGSANWEYTIYLESDQPIQVYCDMITNGWWRTRTHMLSYDAIEYSRIEYTKIFTQNKSYNGSWFTLDISNFSFDEFAYLTDNSGWNVELLGSWSIKTVWNKDEWFQHWVNTYSSWEHCYYVNSCSTNRTKSWYYFTDIEKNNKFEIQISTNSHWENTWYHHMRWEKLLSWANWWSHPQWQWTNMPFWKRNLALNWCYGWKNNCWKDSWQQWASLWLR